MTTFYDILKPHLSQTMIDDIQNDFELIESSNLNKIATYLIMSVIGLVISAIGLFTYYQLSSTQDNWVKGLLCFLVPVCILSLITHLASLMCQEKKLLFEQKTFAFITSVNALYEEYIESDKIAAILQSQQVRITLPPDNPVAQKLYTLEQAAGVPLPNFNSYLSVKAWLLTEAKYLDLKEFMAAKQI